MSVRKVRWGCPHGCAGVLGPSRPRKDDVRRYCLACSARTGRLVSRVAATLERARTQKLEVQKERVAARSEVLAQRQAEYYTVAGVNVHEAMLTMLGADAFKEIRARGVPKLQIRRASMRPRRWGVAWSYQNRLQVTSWPGVTAEIVQEVLVHELSHLATPGAGHSVRWKTTYRLACEQIFGIRPRVEKRFCGEVAGKLAEKAERAVDRAERAVDSRQSTVQTQTQSFAAVGEENVFTSPLGGHQ